MTSRLAIFRESLHHLRRKRSGYRAVAAWSALGASVIISLLGIFLIDFIFNLSVFERIVVLTLAAAAVAWSFWRFTRPLIGRGESEIEVALLVERQHQIDTDLVAALQFESAQAGAWGSPELKSAVIGYVAAATPSIDVFRGFDSSQFARRVGLFTGCAAVLLLTCAIAPRHVAAFANRLCLGSMHYPTRTRIEKIFVNHTAVSLSGNSAASPADCKAAQGHPLRFLVQCTGRLPASGRVMLTADNSASSRTQLELRPLSAAAEIAAVMDDWAADRGASVVLAGELPRLNDNLIFKLTAGDAWTEPARIQMIPLPVIATKIDAKPPQYAAARVKTTPSASGQLAVLEGSSVDVSVESFNRKPLASAWMMVQNSEGPKRVDLVPQDAQRLIWSLQGGDSPLREISRELRYEIQVVDLDGLSLEAPIRGTIRIRPDEPPSIVADVLHKVVLPTAEPVIRYRATDDYGISKIALLVSVERSAAKTMPSPAYDSADAGAAAQPAAAIPVELHRFEVQAGKEPLVGERLPMAGNFPLSLSPLKLMKGDSLKLTLEVTDYRGENDQGQPIGHTALSDSLVLQVSDESGVLAAIAEGDQRSEQQLSEIIKRQLGIGEEPR